MTEGNSQFAPTELDRARRSSGSEQRGETRARPMNWLERNGVDQTEIGRVLQARWGALESFEQSAARPIREADVVERTDLEVYREVMGGILDELKQSDAVRAARAKVKNEGYAALTDLERDALLDAFDRARRHAIERVEMSGGQKRRLQFAATSGLNYSLRSYIREGTPEDWMILDPKLRRIDFMGTTEVLRYLRNSGTPSQDVAFIEADPDIPEETKAAVAGAKLEKAA